MIHLCSRGVRVCGAAIFSEPPNGLVNVERARNRQQAWLARGSPEPDRKPDSGLIRRSVRVIRRLLCALMLRPADPERAIARENRRQQHQTRAILSHYRRRGDRPPTALLTG
jgi:hypothetical protein